MTGAIWKSAIVAALFAVHPLHVESVAWVSERKDVLSAVFFMLTLIAYVRYVRTPSNARYLTVAIMFTFGLMSKSMLISTPCVLLLLDYWPLNRFKQFPSTGDATISGCDDQTQTIGRLFLEKVPLFVLSAAAGAITFILQKRATGAIPPNSLSQCRTTARLCSSEPVRFAPDHRHLCSFIHCHTQFR